MPFLAAAAAAVLVVGAGAYGCSRRDNSDRLSDSQIGGGRDVVVTNANRPTAPDPSKRCASGKTYEQLKRDLFRRAAEIRGSSDLALFERIASAAALRVERPFVTSQDEGLGSIACAATASIDLPPGLAVTGGRTSVTADLAYTLQPAADGSGDVLSFTNADAIVVPLATIGKQAGNRDQLNPMIPTDEGRGAQADAGAVPRPAPAAPPVVVQRPAPPVLAPAPRPPATAAQPRPAPSVSIRPSFDCAYARTRSEIAVCRDPDLAALDRQMGAQYRSAMASASPGQRAALTQTRSHFLGYLDNCTSDACIAGGYRDRMREIDDIVRDDGL